MFSQEGDAPAGSGIADWIRHLGRAVGKRVHRRTRASFVRDELLFRPGDCHDAVLVEESGRLLRELPFLDHAHVAVDSVSADRVDARVSTRDAWSLRLSVRPEFDDGLKLTRVSLGEQNLWGTGTLVRAYVSERDERRDLGVELGRPRLVGTRMDGRIGGGRTRTGSFFHESLTYPFVGEVGRWAFVESYAMREDLFRYAASPDSDFAHVALPFRTRRAGAALGLRTGRPGDLTVFAVGASWEDVRFPGFPGDVTTVQEFDFSNGRPADAATVALVRPQVAPKRAARLGLVAGKRSVGYVERAGLDLVRGAQDVRVGTQALVSASATVGGRGERLRDRSREVRGGVALFAGAAGRRWVFASELDVEAGRLLDAPPGADALQDVLGRAGAFLYWQPQRTEGVGGRAADPGRHTVVLALTAAGGWHSSLPFQLTLGGPRGVRGYDRDEFPVGQRALLHVEDRIALVGGPLGDVFDLGVALFVDAGAGWHGDVPFGEDTGLRGAAGIGLLWGPQPETRSLVRVDLAVPLRAGGLDRIQVRIGYDAVSLLEGFRDRQLRRGRGESAWTTVLGR